MADDNDPITRGLAELSDLMRDVDAAVQIVRVQSITIARLAIELEAAQEQLALEVRFARSNAAAAAKASAVPIDMPATAALPSLLTTAELASLFSKTTETIREWMKSGKLDGQQINGYWHATRESVEALLA